ncbi:MAG: hypothetical protein H2038_01955 [Brevundimonas sp.]|uniref:hypothetical protein n=1 Tax=Brevundimonas sp. TaxID=1871086 RepID=UPI0018187FEB|nr:hypothetical protein [Brevundimonas sp.]MBA4803395.1 hypothetical protein [Brevundimonas sp.]
MPKRTLNLVLAAVVAAGSAAAAPAWTQDRAAGVAARSPEVVERGPDGRVKSVRVEGVVYPVCQREGEDSCIQPRAAGLGWGDRPMQRWPGAPASARQGSDSADRSAARR